eukprot:TRINITY_DN18242_c0_g1_i2.p1 TRINITY_DN18242_c0_g1~~TRINITY_DN18242_c0_g1_i2.p1  ORF type:complete len:825 (-),score=151.54 TRINITY_DN18242_c0_g1_i2:131-2530(-)
MQGGAGQRRSGRSAAEPKAPSGRRDFDLNRERLVFCLSSLVGQKVTTKLRNNIIYEGLFHSCSLEGDYSITLKCARLVPTVSVSFDAQMKTSEEVISTLVIPGKDFLQVSAVDVPSPCYDTKPPTGDTTRAFFIDAEIAVKKAPGKKITDRELVPWSPGAVAETRGFEDEALEVADGALEPIASGPRDKWDQFGANQDLYGVKSTYNEDLYTTPLDPNSIPKEKREEADRIAREIESGQMAAEVEGRIEAQDQEGDEEANFSAVQGRNRKIGNNFMQISDMQTGSSASAPAAQTPAPPTVDVVPLTREHLSQHDRLSVCESKRPPTWDNLGLAGEGFAREHRAKRGMITAHSAHSPMRSPMISEMKRINALNLEPALPKLDDRTRNDWINFKQNRPVSRSVQGHGLKHEFQQALDSINKRSEQREASTKQSPQDGNATGSDQGADLSGRRGSGKAAGPQSPASEHRKSSGFMLNPSAKEFSFNPAAATFTPSHGGGPASPSGGGNSNIQPMSPQAKPPSPAPPQSSSSFPLAMGNTDLLGKNLADILDGIYERARGESPELITPDWPEAVGSSFHEVLGQPRSMPGVGPMAAPVGGNMPGQWQPANPMPGGGQGQGQMGPGPGGPPQMAPHGFMTVAAGNAPGGQQQPQMYPQLYTAPGSGVQGRPQNGSNMGPQQQPMVFNQQGLMAQQQPGLAMPGGMVGTTQVVPTMVMQGGQFGAQGFVPQQGQPGPPGAQGGGPQHRGQQGQMMQQQQQGQMGMQPGPWQRNMRPGWGQPGNDGRRMGGGGPPGHGPMGGGMDG